MITSGLSRVGPARECSLSALSRSTLLRERGGFEHRRRRPARLEPAAQRRLGRIRLEHQVRALHARALCPALCPSGVEEAAVRLPRIEPQFVQVKPAQEAHGDERRQRRQRRRRVRRP